MKLKTASTQRSHLRRKRHEEQIQSLAKNLNTYVNPFHGAARNIATGAEVPVSIANGLLSSREKGEESLK